MKQHHSPRPEDRRRSGHDDSPIRTDWIDTLPCCFRSEAFAEDLHGLPAAQQAAPAGKRHRPDRPRLRRDRWWLPNLGLNLAGLFGSPGR